MNTQSHPPETGAPMRIAPPRPQVLQVRVSEEEQKTVVERAKEAGYDSISAYMRAAALGRLHQPV